MKTRRSAALVIVLSACLLMLGIWRARRPSETSPLAPAETSNVLTATGSIPSTGRADHANSAGPATAKAADASQSTAGRKDQEMLDLMEGNDVPIVFYGRLVDQFGDPVADAEITGRTIVYNALRAGTGQFTATSDANGYFTLNAGKGESLGIVPRKTGYIVATTSTLFKYSRFEDGYVSDSNNPAVIKMWKLQGSEPLVAIDQNYAPHWTGTPICFDLIAAKIVPSGGDFKITVNRPEGIISQQHPQSWSIQVEPVDGGFIAIPAAEAKVTYFAPETGYQPSGVFENNNGPDLVDKTLLFRSRNGQVFGKVHLLFGINDTPDASLDATFKGVANTNGSRNFEADANAYKPQ